MANLFISYRKCDTSAAEQLAQELRAASHDVWFDEWKITLGDSIIQRMNEGLESSSSLILCYSSIGVDSEWISREWMSALARQLSGQGIKILPVVLTGGAPPAIMADIKYIDLTNDWDAGVAKLLDAI